MNILCISLDNTDYGDEEGKSRSLEIYLAESFTNQGHKVHLICERNLYYTEEDPKPKNLTYQVYPVNETRFVNMDDFIDQNKLEFDFKPDIIFCSSITGCNIGNYLKRKLEVPLVTQILDIPVFRWRYPNFKKEWDIYLNQARGSDMLIANTTSTKDTIRRSFNGELDDRTKLIYYCINTEIADKIPEQEKDIDIILVGRLVFHKTFEKLIYALAVLKKEGIKPKTVIIGDLREGPASVPLLDLCFFAGLDNIEFVGGVNEEKKYELIKRAKMHVNTDSCEYIGSLVTLEGEYCKVPCICSNMLINRERFGKYPVYVDTFNISEWVKEIKFMLKNPNCKDDILEEAKKWVKENKTIEVQAKETLEVFEECLKEN